MSSSPAAGDPPSDDLDDLLDSALDDFNKLDLGKNAGLSSSSSFKSASSGPTGLGMGLPDRRKGKQRAPTTPMRAPTTPMRANTSSYASEALEKLTQQTRETVRGLETVTAAGAGTGGAAGRGLGEGGFQDEAMVEEFVKQFEELAGSQDMESIVETMMQQLLSPEILHEPMKEIASKYPQWLESHKTDLSESEFARYTKQHTFIIQLNEVYEKDPGNFTKIVDLMQKMQECGQPPEDLVKEIAPDLDMATFGQMSPGLFESPENCNIM